VSGPKLPVSVLVVIHTPALEILLIERAARPGYWQSVTGSIDRPDEPLEDAAVREVFEETGIVAPRDRLVRWDVMRTFEIYPQWRHRFAPGTTHNDEHMFSLEVPGTGPVRLAPEEHTAWQWLPWKEAVDKCFSWTNRDAITMLAESRRNAGGIG
jgi:dihydroneopterin triphosphate diphosphatase